jgi:hypothetical protein
VAQVSWLIRADGRRTGALPFHTSPGFMQELWLFLNDLIAKGGIHAEGAIVAWGGGLPPAGWLICDGSAVSRTAFPKLFAAIGTTYGAGDGATTFLLPDLTTDPTSNPAPPETVVESGSVVPATGGVADAVPEPDGQTGGTGGNTVTGGRPPSLREPGTAIP